MRTTTLSSMMLGQIIIHPPPCWRRNRRWPSSPKYTHPYVQLSDTSRVARVSSMKSKRPMSIWKYFLAPSILEFLYLGVRRGILVGALTEPTVLRILCLVVFDTSGRPTSAKIDLLAYPTFLQTSLSMLRISLSFTVLEIPESQRYFLREKFFWNLLTVSTWRPNFYAMASEELTLADF